MILSTFVVFLPVAWAAVRVENNDLLWAAMALFMLARTITLWVPARSLLGRLEGR
jgi:Na+-driven multidrug efflux pump